MTITAAGTAVGGSAAILVVIGVGTRSPYPVVASVPLLLFIVLARLVESQPHLDVAVDRTPPDAGIYEGESAEFKIRISNLGPDIDALEVMDTIPDELSVKSGTNHFLGPLRGGASVEFTYAVSPGVFGVHRVGPLRVRSLDILGLFAEERTFGSYFDLKVYPEVQYVSEVKIKPRNARNWPGEILTRKSGTGMEFYGIREYTPGDSRRRINWKASSRTDGLLSNEFMSEFGGDTIIVLDVRSESNIGVPPESTTTYSTRAAAVVAYRLLRDRNRVGMITMGDRLDKVRPGFGRRQFDRLLTSMVRTKPGDIWNIGNLAGYLSMFFSRMTQIVVVSPLMDDKSYEAIVEVSSKGYPVLVISPSPIEFEKRGKEDGRVQDIAEELVRLDREMRVSLLREYASVVDWNVREPLSHALRQANPVWVRGR